MFLIGDRRRLSHTWIGTCSIVLNLVAFAPELLFSQTPSWEQIDVGGRGYRNILVYDSNRSVSVLYGGGVETGDTWERVGGRWRKRAVPGPPTRSGYALAYDSDRNVTVLVGGQEGNTRFNDTWEWDGFAWQQRATTGPSPQAGAAMVYDSRRHVMVLFGGTLYSGASRETWEWDGDVWSLRSNTGPPADEQPIMCFDAARGVTLLYGRYSQGTWKWDGNSWDNPQVYGPATSYNATAIVYDDARRQVVLLGSTSLGMQTWVWNGEVWIQRAPLHEPTHSGGHSLIYDSSRQVVSAFGGYDGVSRLSEWWEWDGLDWAQVDDGGPGRRTYHKAVFDSHRNVTVVFGGLLDPGSGDDFPTNELWEYGPQGWIRRDVDGPVPRYRHAMAYDSIRNVTVMFGGFTAQNDFTWEWDGDFWTPRGLLGPPMRAGHAMTFDSNRGVVVMFGGSSSSAIYNDTWEWNGITWVRRMVSGPTPRRDHAMAFDPERGVTILYGGYYVAALSDTWEWDGTTWINRGVTGPPPMHSGSMTYDPAHHSVLLGGQTLAEPWDWDGQQWTPRPYGRPNANSGVYVYDSRIQAPMLVGQTGGFPAATWALCTPPVIETQPVLADGCLDGTASFSTAASGRLTVFYQWRRNARDLQDEPGHIMGSQSPTLVLTSLTAEDAGLYDCIVSDACRSVTTVAQPLLLCELQSDLDCDHQVGIPDLAILLSNFGRSDGPRRAEGNIDGDQIIGLADLALVLAEFGSTCD
ncbi:MAG: hypothetical protein AMXMBFR47_16680 [Planctomycetota bacterium]